MTAQVWEKELDAKKKQEKAGKHTTKTKRGKRLLDKQAEASLNQVWQAYEAFSRAVTAYVLKLERGLTDNETRELKAKRQKKLKAALKLENGKEALWTKIKNCEQ